MKMGDIKNISIVYNPRMKEVMQNYYLAEVINDIDIKDRLI